MKLPKNFKTIVKPYNYQIEAIVYGIIHPQAGILLDLGLGKTFCAINIARYRLQQKQVKRVLVVVPTSIMLNWKNEIEKYSEYKALILHSNSRSERIAMVKAMIRRETFTFGVINYEALANYFNILKAIKFNMIIFDESARFIKTHDTNRTLASIVLADQAQYKLILTGTPIGNRPIDLWSQFRVLDGGKLFYDNFFAFRGKYFEKAPGGFSIWTLKEEYYFTIHSKIYTICIRKTKEECLPDLPKQIFKTIEIPLDGEFKKIYSIVRREILSEIETEVGRASLNISNILVRLQKLQQVTSGIIIDSFGKSSKLKHTPKLDALLEEVESIIDAEECVIIWCRFIKSIGMIENELKRRKIKYLTMSGKDIGNEAKYKKWKTYQLDKSIPVFIGQIESGGIGIELFKIDSTDRQQHMIFYENMWTPDIREQAIGRSHRIGQNSMCVYIDIVVKDSIDERILDTIQKKKKVADILLQEGIGGLV